VSHVVVVVPVDPVVPVGLIGNNRDNISVIYFCQDKLKN
jgi:hypothetical protein